MSEILQQIYQLITSSRKVLLLTHHHPDGDALSSLCAMVDLLLQEQKDFVAFCHNQPNPIFDFLPHLEQLSLDRSAVDFASFDLIISLDCGSWARTGFATEIKQRHSGQIYIDIDHHPRTDAGADIEARDPQAAATTEILYYFYQVNNLLVNERVANCLLTGLVTDTGNFVYPVTTQATIAIASEMLKRGARLPRIVDQTWRNKSLPALKLWGLAMSRLQVHPATNIAVSVLTRDDFDLYQVSEEAVEDMAGFMGNLPQVRAVLLLRQIQPGLVKGSLRTCRPEVDVSRIAKFWGGGGHAKAAGFTVKGNLKLIGQHWKIEEIS